MLVLFGTTGPARTRLEMGLTGSREIRDQERRALESQIVDRKLGEELGSEAVARIVKRVFALNRTGDVGFRCRNMAALLYRYFRDMFLVLQNISDLVRPGGDCFFVIGDNKTTAGGRVVAIRSGDALTEMGQRLGWTLESAIPITVTKEAVVHAQHAITANTVLHFRTPAT